MDLNPHLPMVGDVLLSFPTPIFVRHWPESEEMNRELHRLVLAKRDQIAGMDKSNFGGAWHSEEDLFEWGGPAIAELQRRVVDGAQAITSVACGEAVKGLEADFRVTGWANLLRDRGYNGIHNHPDCTWSGAYYVTLGERAQGDPRNGVIEFLDPRMGVNWVQLPGQPFGTQLQINPQAGTMVMFPSWMQHWVHPFHGTGERISLAFNVRMQFRPAAAK
jgi:uncharacterized protein (TIGR02466 family)